MSISANPNADNRDANLSGGSWALGAQASAASGQLASRGKFWAQRVQLRALQGSALNFVDHRKRVLQAVAAICVLQVRPAAALLSSLEQLGGRAV